jgi:hypothetical protein
MIEEFRRMRHDDDDDLLFRSLIDLTHWICQSVILTGSDTSKATRDSNP